jgi:hypothetical protein
MALDATEKVGHLGSAPRFSFEIVNLNLVGVRRACGWEEEPVFGLGLVGHGEGGLEDGRGGRCEVGLNLALNRNRDILSAILANRENTLRGEGEACVLNSYACARRFYVYSTIKRSKGWSVYSLLHGPGAILFEDDGVVSEGYTGEDMGSG